MKQILCAVITVLTLSAGHAVAEEHLTYNRLSKANDRVIERIDVYYSIQPNGDRLVRYESKRDQISFHEVYGWKSDWRTTEWQVVHSEEKTNYIGRRKGNTLHVQGTHLGKNVDSTFRLDSAPLYNHPRLNLQGFAKSKKKKLKFWVLRPDTLKPYKMVARKKGSKEIKVQGIAMKAIEVTWSPPGMASMFFSRTHWYLPNGTLVRMSDSETDRTQLVEHRPLSSRSKVTYNIEPLRS